MTSINPEQVALTLSSSDSLMIVNLAIGLVFTLSGGFFTAHLAKKLELKVMWKETINLRSLQLLSKYYFANKY